MKAKDMWYIDEPVNRKIRRGIHISGLSKEINKLGKAIDSAPRYLILESLSKSPKTVGQLTGIINTSQPTMSQHLKLLQQLNFVDGFKNGKQVTYKLNTEYIVGLLNKLTVIFRK